MTSLASMPTCPNCTAPLLVGAECRAVICIYCNTSSIIRRGGSDAAATEGESTALAAQAVAKEDVEKIKQLLIDGKLSEAISHYQAVSGLTAAEAKVAVESIMLTAYWTITRHVPINRFGFVLYAVLVGFPGAFAAWLAVKGLESPAAFLLAAPAGLLSVWQFVRFLGHLRSTLICEFGALGRGRVIRSAVVRYDAPRRTSLTVVLFEVTPDDGSLPFVDQETLFLGEESVKKIVAGNTIAVRFSGGRDRVFPVSPVAVL